MSETEPGRAEALDGRHARTGRSRDVAVRALLALIRENSEEPTADMVAERAGLSRRTVFRLFRDLESLHLAADEMQSQEVIARYPPPFPIIDEPLTRTIERLVTHRANVYEHVAPMRLVAERMRHEHRFVAKSLDEAAEMFRMHLRLLFMPHLAADNDVAWQLLELLTAWTSWHTLRTTQGCSSEEAKQLLCASLLRVLQ